MRSIRIPYRYKQPTATIIIKHLPHLTHAQYSAHLYTPEKK